MPLQHARSTTSQLLLAQNVTTQQSGPAAHSKAHKSEGAQNQAKTGSDKAKSGNAAQPSDNTTPGTTPWLGAPPQFQRTWPPNALPQSDDNDDLLLMLAPHKPPKVHKA
jgi:hypothetical protein